MKRRPRVRYRYDVITARKYGVVASPRRVILRYAPDATGLVHVRSCRCWLFTAEPIAICANWIDMVRQ
mgnify:FL=1